MSKTRELTCIDCPIGCALTITIEDKKVTNVYGNTCIKGKSYAQKECTNPTRILTSTVKVKDGKMARVSIKTEKDIPKNKIIDCIKEIKGINAKAPIYEGDIIIENVAGTNINIIASKNIEKLDI